MTEHLFEIGLNKYKYHLYNFGESFLDYDYPVLLVCADDGCDFIKPYLYRQILKIDNLSQLENIKSEFLFVFPIAEKGQFDIIEKSVRQVTLTDNFFFV